MSKSKATISNKLSKKEAKQLVYVKIAGALADFKSNFKEKKFETRLKKASKLFAADLAKSIGKKVSPEKPRKEKEKRVKKELVPSEEPAQ